MKQLDFYIDGQRMNYREVAGFPLSFSYSIDVAEDPSKLSGSHSKRQVSIPGDSETEQMFQEWVNAGRENVDASKMRPCRIEANGLPVFTGNAQLDEVSAAGSFYGRVGSDYKVGLLGNNASWFDLVKDIQIRMLEMMPQHDLTDAVVSANDSPVIGTDTWGYTVIRTKDWAVSGEVAYTEFTPFIFIRPILIEAFRRAGYKIASAFFDTDFFSRLILPVPLQNYADELLNTTGFFIYDQCFAQTLLFTGINHIAPYGPNHSTGGACPPGFYQNNGGHYDNASGVWTCPISGYYLFGVVPLVSGEHRTIEVDGVLAPDPFDPWPYFPGAVSGRVYIPAGASVKLTSSGIFANITEVYWAMKADFHFEAGQAVVPEWLISPSWTVDKIVQGVTHAFGLMWDTDVDAQTIGVEPRDRYQITTWADGGATDTADGFLSETGRLDMTLKIDLSKVATARNLTGIKEKFNLTWKADGADPNVEALDKGQEFKYASARYTFPTGKFQTGSTANENPFFAKTMHLLDASIQHSSSTIVPQIPLMQSAAYGEENEDVGDFEPRILYFAGRRSGLDGYVKLHGGAAYDYPAAFMVNYNDASGFDPSLSFGPELLRGGLTVPGLMQRFHLQYLKRLEIGKQLSEYLRWQELDILGLSFRRKILLNDSLYILQQINGYKPLRDDSAETILLKDEVPTADDLTKISGATIKGYLPKSL